MKNIFPFLLLIALISCGPSSQRKEIDRRKAAIVAHRDSALSAAQADLLKTDSVLAIANKEYEQAKASAEAHKAQGKATATELNAVTRLRMRRDSLQVRCDALGYQIRYIHKQQKK